MRHPDWHRAGLPSPGDEARGDTGWVIDGIAVSRTRVRWGVMAWGETDLARDAYVYEEAFTGKRSGTCTDSSTRLLRCRSIATL